MGQSKDTRYLVIAGNLPCHLNMTREGAEKEIEHYLLMGVKPADLKVYRLVKVCWEAEPSSYTVDLYEAPEEITKKEGEQNEQV